MTERNGATCARAEVEPVYERYIDSGLDTYNPLFIQQFALATSGARQSSLLRFAVQARATVYLQVRGPGVLWLYFGQESVDPGVTLPHIEVTQAAGIVALDVAPGAYNWVLAGDGSAACDGCVSVLEREARKQKCAS